MERIKESVFAKCPFYGGETSCQIACEGVIEGTNVRTSFKSHVPKRKHTRIYCTRAYTECALYKAIYRKYEDDH